MLPLRLARLNFTTTAPAIMKDGRAVISGDWGNLTCGMIDFKDDQLSASF